MTLSSGPKLGPDFLAEILCGGKVRLIAQDLHCLYYSDRGEAVPPAIRSLVMARDLGICSIEGCRSRYRLQIHHIHPRSRGGSHHPDNLITFVGITTTSPSMGWGWRSTPSPRSIGEDCAGRGAKIPRRTIESTQLIRHLFLAPGRAHRSPQRRRVVLGLIKHYLAGAGDLELDSDPILFIDNVADELGSAER